MLARVIIEVEKGNPGCVHGHQTGQRMIYEGTRISGDICVSALVSMFPILYTLKNGGNLSYADDKGKVRVCCSDIDNLVIFKCWRE
jgi:uncharacterized repeat protein (TIGR04076 family)